MSTQLQNSVIDKEGDTMLHSAARSNNVNLAKLLISAGCDVNVENKYGQTPLWCAFDHNRLEMVKTLLGAGAKLLNNTMFLFAAAENGWSEIVQLLLKSGYDCKACDESIALHAVTYQSNIDSNERCKIIKLLVDAGANLNAKDDYHGDTPLMCAMDLQCDKCIDLMLSLGAGILEKGVLDPNVLMYAARCKYSYAFKRLIELGWDVNSIDDNGDSCLHAAAGQTNIEIVKFLIDKGMAIDVVNKDGFDPLCLALKEWSNHYDEVLLHSKLLRQENKDPDKLIENYLGQFYIDQIKCLNILIEHGANVNRVTKDLTPLYIVLGDIGHHSNLVKILLKNGATFDFEHPLVDKVVNNSKLSKFAHLLLRHAATFDAQDRSDGPTNFDMIELSKESQKDYARCRDELELMKRTKIDNTNVSFFNVLVNPDIGPFTRNEHIVAAFEAMDVSKRFPVYYDILVNRFFEEVKLQKIVRKATENLGYILNWDQSSKHILLSKVISYLTKKDLINLGELENY